MSSDEDKALQQAKDRAQGKEIAVEAVSTEQHVELAPFVLMRSSGHWYAADALSVLNVVAKERITRVPGTERNILGLALVHGSLIPVVDLAGLTGSSGSPVPALTEPRLVVLGSAEACVAVIAEEAYGIEELPRNPHQFSTEGILSGETFWQERQFAYLNVGALVAVGQSEVARP